MTEATTTDTEVEAAKAAEPSELEKAANLLHSSLKTMIEEAKEQTLATIVAMEAHESSLKAMLDQAPSSIGFHPYIDSLQAAYREVSDMKGRLVGNVGRFDMNLRANTGDPTLPMP